MEMISLFDYLGRPAGSELGLKVAESARKIGITPGKRFVKNPGYTEMIKTYPEEFLKLYFKKSLNEEEEIELPF